jgi:hypothetical protein
MKLAFLYIILLLGFGSAFGQSSKTIRTYGIEKKTETLIIYSNGIEVARYTEEVEMYNSEGDWVEKLLYSSGGELKLHQKRTYDGDEVIDETTIDLNGSGIKNAKPPSFERIQYAYDKGELILEKELSRNGEVLEQKEYSYNKLGDLIKVTTKDEDGSIVKTETIEYDNRGLKIKESETDSAGVILKEKIFVYE